MPVVHRTSILTATPITASPKDQIVTRDARRIVSLLPGATEWVCELGLASRLVGVSHECDYPPQVNSLPRVTRSRINSQQSGSEIDAAVRQHSETRTPLYDLDVDTLARLKPDLILTLTANPDILLIACCGMDADRTRTELSPVRTGRGLVAVAMRQIGACTRI